MIVRAGEFHLSLPKLGQGRLEHELNEFLDNRMSKSKYQNYIAQTEIGLERSESLARSGEIEKEFLDSDLRSYFPLEMLPMKIQEAFNYVPGDLMSIMSVLCN